MNARSAVAFATQCNIIDLTRRSPSYENRLAKYRQRGFEIYRQHLERDRLDPKIYERAFSRTNGLARLMVIEKVRSPDPDLHLFAFHAISGKPTLKNSHAVADQILREM